MLTAANLVPMVRKLVESFLEEIGDEESVQNSYIFDYVTRALRRLAGVAYQEKDSDALYISSDDYAIFQIGGVDITDIYAPLRILDPQGRDTQKRVSFADTRGWWRESTNTRIHIKGFSHVTNPLPAGNYTLQYLKYPSTVSSLSSVIDFPDAGEMGLCYFVAALVMESRPSAKDLSTHYYNLAAQHLKVAEQATIDGRGTSSGGFVPSLARIDAIFGG
jgi:hypothetical protein